MPRHLSSFCSLLLAASVLCLSAGCGRETPESAPPAREGKGPPPAYPLIVPASLYNALPDAQKPMVEKALWEQKRDRLFRTPALLPALEIVRNREAEFVAAAKAAGMEPRLFEGLVVLECGGREDAIDYMFLQGRGKRAHVGLGQIGSFEGQGAGLKVSAAHEERLKAEIRRAIRLARAKLFDGSLPHPEQADAALLNSLRRQLAIEKEWRAVDERFDSRKNLLAAARLLKERMNGYGGDPTLAIASYHAGGGNIGKALRLYKKVGKKADRPTFWTLYEDRSGPVYQLMSGWSDSSRNYFPTVVAAADVVEKYLNHPEQFRAEYAYWGPEDAKEHLAAIPYISPRS